MTKIVRASLGLPTLRAGPQFQNSIPVWVIDYWNLRFICNLVLGIWDFSFRILDCGFKCKESVFSFFAFLTPEP